MSEDETGVEETVMLTRRERRRSSAETDAVADAPTAVEPEPESAADAPRDVVDDGAPPDDGPDDATVVVVRSVPARPAPSADAHDDADDGTDHAASDDAIDGASSDDGTDHAASQNDASDDAASDDATVVVARSVPRSREDDAPSGDDPDDALSDSDSLFRAPHTPTPAIYRPRPAPLAPHAPPVVTGGAAPTRVTDVERTSVARQARRWSVYTLMAVAGACVVSAAGLVGLAFVVLS